jgi:serine/threonine protein kinase
MNHPDLLSTLSALPANPLLGSEDALPAGTRLGDFEIETVLARSAVALVYGARALGQDLPVAIKEFLPIGLVRRHGAATVALRDGADEPSFERGLGAFIDEARTLSRCRHASLMQVLQILECNGTAYRVMPFCPGPTLREYRLKLAGAPAESWLRGLLEDLLGALSEWHQTGRVHGAVSPGNILMLPDHRPRLLDSQAVHAAMVSDRTRSMIAALEPSFAPLEQLEPSKDRPIGPWTDLYALASTLHFCVAGAIPAAHAERPAGAATEPADPVQGACGAAPRLLPEVPSWLAAMDPCLGRYARARPQSVLELRRLLGFRAAGHATPVAPAPVAVAPPVRAETSSTASTPPAVPPSLASPPAEAGRDAIAAMQPTGQTPPAEALPEAPAQACAAETTAETDQALETGPGQDGDGVAAAQIGMPLGSAALAIASLPATDRARDGWVAAVVVVAFVALGAVLLWMPEERPAEGLADAAAPAALPPTTGNATRTALDTPRPVARPADVSPGSAGPAPTAATVPSRVAPAPGPASAGLEPAPAPSKARALPASPREVCGNRARYALYQCLQTQCAKPAWTRHAQCVRLRQEQKLG